MQQIISLLLSVAARSRCPTTFVLGDFTIVHCGAAIDVIFLQHVHLINHKFLKGELIITFISGVPMENQDVLLLQSPCP